MANGTCLGIINIDIYHISYIDDVIREAFLVNGLNGIWKKSPQKYVGNTFRPPRIIDTKTYLANG